MVFTAKSQQNYQAKKQKIAHSFFQTEDVVVLGRALLGKYLFTAFDGVLTGGIITETESYKGVEDKACHAYNYRKTKRTEVMFASGGIAYVYLCYGIHTLFNIVTNKKDVPHAILIRAFDPTDGIEHMLSRRKKKKPDTSFTRGPGCVTEALGINVKHNGLPVTGPEIWLEDREMEMADKQIVASPRVGIDYAEEDALLPWRFRLLKK